MKHIIIIFSIVSLLGAGCLTALAHGLTVTPYVILDVKEPLLAPGDFFYFAKKISWGIRQAFAFDSIKKTELELKRTDEALAESYKVAASGSADAFDQALENYRSAQERLQSRLEMLKDANKNTEEIVQKILRRMLDHETAFSAMQDDLGASNGEKLRVNAAKTLKKAQSLDEGAFKKGLMQIVENPAQYSSYMIFGESEALLAELGKKVSEEHGKKANPPKTPPLSNPSPPRKNSSEGSEIFCTENYSPVCGLDGKTYSNSCKAETAGVGVQYEGKCSK